MAASKISEINLVVLKYEQEFTKRSKDIKKNTWFSFPNDYLLHPDFVEINGEELKWFIWIISICSKLNLNKIRLNIAHAEKMLSSEQKNLFSMIEKLKGKQIDVVCDQSATESRPDHDHVATAGDQGAAPTLHYITDTTLQNITLHNTTPSEVDQIVDFWNAQEKLPKIISISQKRKDKINKRLEHKLFDWKKIIPMISESKFLLGESENSDWKANFDWFIKNDDNFLKILEGVYADKETKPVIKNKASAVFDQARAQIEKINAGVL